MINVSTIATKIASDWEAPTSRRDSWRRKLPSGGFEYRYTNPDKKQKQTENKIPEFIDHKIREEEAKIYSDEIEHLLLFDSDGKKVLELKGEEDYCPFDGHQADLKDKWVTHNHPGSTSFSWQDLFLMKKYGAKGMRITSRKFDYQVIFNENFTEEDIKQEHSIADMDVRIKMYERLAAKEITIPEANAIHAHLVWLIVSKKLGFTYERIEHR